jgi:hypothetical protein
MRIPLLAEAALAVVVVLGATAVLAQSRPPATTGHGMDMAKMHEQMMADMKAADARLDALVMTMNMTSGDARLDAAIAVINELARQKKAMSEKMAQMHAHMMRAGEADTARAPAPADPHKH